MNRGASITSFADAPAGRAIPAVRASTFSLQDDLLRIFGGERMQNLMLRLGMEEDVPIESKMITKRIAAAQKAVEAQHFASRKHVLEYDDVMNKQRQAVYGMRQQLLKERIIRKSASRKSLPAFSEPSSINSARKTSAPINMTSAGLQTASLNQFGVKVETDDLDRSQCRARSSGRSPTC